MKPNYIQKLPQTMQTNWETVVNMGGVPVANQWLSRELDKNRQEIVAKSEKFRRVKFDIDGSKTFISKSANGDEYVSFMLTDVFADNQGDTYSSELLLKWCDEINKGNSIVGDVNHEEYDEIVATYGSSDMVKQKLKEKGGIAKAVKAVFEKGKLWVKALIDKRYKKTIEKANGVSLEALVNTGSHKDEGDLLGFTFTVDQPAANPRAKITK